MAISHQRVIRSTTCLVQGGVFGDGGSNCAIFGSIKSKRATGRRLGLSATLSWNREAMGECVRGVITLAQSKIFLVYLHNNIRPILIVFLVLCTTWQKKVIVLLVGQHFLYYTVWVKKNPPCGFLILFPNGWEFLINFYTPITRSFLH